MTLKASDLPADGSSKLVLLDGVLFEVARERSTMDARRSVYKARVVPPVGDLVVPPSPNVGWWGNAAGVTHESTGGGYWFRFTWKLMLADMRLMAKQEDEE